MEFDWNTATSVAVGLGLAAACGFRVFVPLLGIGLAARAGILPLSEGFAWMGSTPAIVAFAVATLLEVAAYFIPLVDNTLDAVATPAAVVAGILAMASTVAEPDPMLAWAVAIIAGGGAAGLVQGTTALGRAASTVTTAGTGNFVVSGLELIGSVLMTLLSFVLPIFVAMAVIIFMFAAIAGLIRRLFRSRPAREAR